MEQFTTIDPANGEVVERFEEMTNAEIERCLVRSSSSFHAWSAASHEERRRLFRALASVMRAQSETLAHVAVREMGKPVAQARAEIEKCARCCEFYADNAERFLTERIVESTATHSSVAFRPLGAILAIMPWNFPFWQVIRAAAPAMAAGNVLLLKHSEGTTRCALEIERLFREAGFPEGTFVALVANNRRIDELIADARIAAVTLTGSERAGVAVASAAGAALKKCVLELGGSDPFIVLADADLDRAIPVGVKARFQNTGQSCIAAKRFIVEEPVYDEFVARFSEAASRQIVGDPKDPQTEIGPCARADLREALEKQIDGSLSKGARLTTGGRRIERAGWYFAPTVLADVRPGMPAFDEETFGPAAAVIRAKDGGEAIALANRSHFGLGSNLWTRDIERARQLAAQIEAGAVFINGMVASDPRLPFGGVKRSGYGRELSEFGIHEFVNVQTLWVGPEKAPRSARGSAERRNT